MDQKAAGIAALIAAARWAGADRVSLQIDFDS